MIIKDLEIKKVVFKGFGLGFNELGAVFVESAYPGDILDVEVVDKRSKTHFAKIDKIIKPSKMRGEASRCEVFGTCGGCNWLDISYQNQLVLKQKIIEEIFAKFLPVDPIIGSATPYHYRNKSFLPIASREGKAVIGMYQKRSHTVISHNSCAIQPEIFDEISKEVLAYIMGSKVKIYDERSQKGILRHLGFRYSASTQEILVILVCKNRKLPFTNILVNKLTSKFPQIKGIIQNINPKFGNVIIGDDEKILYGQDYLIDTVGEVKYKLHYRSFFQINNSTTSRLYDYVKRCINNDDVVIDAYSGVGTIGLYIANKAKEVIGIESNVAAVNNAKENAELNNISNCRFHADLVENKIAEICQEKNIDAIVFDPPRKGLEESIIELVGKKKIAKIIYISCNPMTQKRDIDNFIKIGYRIKKIQPFDMFPQTWHIENVIELSYEN